MSPVSHITWKNKFTQLDIPVELYCSKWRASLLKLCASPLVPFCTPFYFVATHIRQKKLNNELARNNLWPNPFSASYKGMGMVGP